MFPIRITTLVTEEVYQRFAWSIFLRGKSFLLNIIIFIGILSLYLTFLPDNLKRFSFFTVLFISLVTFSAMYFGMDFQIKKAYQKTPYWKDMEQTLIFEKNKFSVKKIIFVFSKNNTSSMMIIEALKGKKIKLEIENYYV